MMGPIVPVCAVVMVMVTSCLGSETVLNAAIVGRKGEVNIDQYNAIVAATAGDDKSYCRIAFTALEYDNSNGSTLYSSLKNARATFEDKKMTVAIGPQIDVFTSTDYVILHQVHFVTSSDEASGSENRTMSILPDPNTLSQAIAKIAKFLRWRKLAFLSQGTQEKKLTQASKFRGAENIIVHDLCALKWHCSDLVSEVLHRSQSEYYDFSPVLALGSEQIVVSPIRLPSNMESSDNPQLKQTLTTLRESQMDKFILHSMKKDVVKTVIKAAQRLHLLHHSISWFVTYLDFDDIAADIHEMATLYGLQLLSAEAIPATVQDLFNGTVSRLQLGLMVDVVGLLRHYLVSHVHDCFKEPSNSTTMTSDDFQLEMRTTVERYDGALGHYMWPQVGQKGTSNFRNEYSIPIYRYMRQQERLAQVIFGRKGIKIARLMDTRVPVRDDIFKDKYFKVIVKQDEPFVMRHSNGQYYGFCVDVLEELRRKLNNFRYDMYELNNTGSNGKTTKTGGWDGIINELKGGDASVAIGAFAVTAEREEKITFSYTIISSSVSMLLRRPPDTRNFFQFLWPFSTELWVMILVFFLVVGVCMYLMSRFDNTQVASEQKFDLKESMWYSLNVLLQGSTEYSPPTTSTRTIIAFFWFCTLVINAAYTANLAAFLTLQQIDNRIKSVDHLARQTETKYGVLHDSDLMRFFETSRDDPYERMWAFMKLNEDSALMSDRGQALQNVLHGLNGKPFAYLDDGVINNYIVQSNCETESIEQNFGIKHFSMGFPKGAPYRDDMNTALLALKEDGTLDRLRNKWWSPSVNCSGMDTARTSTKVKTASELDFTNMFGVFIVLFVCTALAIVYEIGECIYNAVKRRRTKKVDKDEKVQPTGNDIIFGFPLPETDKTE